MIATIFSTLAALLILGLVLFTLLLVVTEQP